MDRFNISHLSESEKMLLARDLLESAAAQEEYAPYPPEQLSELRRRAAAIDSGEARCIPWDEALASIMKRRDA